jgi:hypothetical protein
MVRQGAYVASRTAAAGINAYIERRLPTLGKILREVRAARDKELEA